MLSRGVDGDGDVEVIAREVSVTQIEAVAEIVQSAAAFRKAFGKGFSEALLAEVYVAQKLGLKLCAGSTLGSDAVSANGERFQIKHRSVGTLNVDTSNFDFDPVVLVNLGDDLAMQVFSVASPLAGMNCGISQWLALGNPDRSEYSPDRKISSCNHHNCVAAVRNPHSKSTRPLDRSSPTYKNGWHR